MIELARPGVFAAAALIALLPLALHFLTRLAPAPSPLPTARFLTPQPLSRVHLARRPTDLGRLALRVLFVLLLGAAFAEPRFARRSEGTASLVVLDGSAAMAPFWVAAVDSLRGMAASGAPLRVVVVGAEVRTVGTSPASLDSLRAAGPSSSAAHADLHTLLETLRREAALVDADSARAWIAFAAERDAWTPGTAEVRREAWPGPIGVIAFSPPDSSEAREAVAAPGPVAIFARTAEETAWLALALEALGTPGAAEPSAQQSPTDSTLERARLIVATSSSVPSDALTRALERGATVVLTAEARAALPDAGAAQPSRHPLVRFEDGLVLRNVDLTPGDAAPGARWLAATGDGEPAALSRRIGAGCLVLSRLDPARLMETQPAALPDVLARLIHGCDASDARADGALPLGEGALAWLRSGGREREPAPVALAPLRDPTPDPLLVRGLLALALSIALLEAYLSYGRRPGPAPVTRSASPSGRPAGITLP